MDNKLIISSTPHIRDKSNIRDVMLDVLIALAPAGIAAVYWFGLRALLLIVIGTLSAVLFEAVYQKITKQKLSVFDLSACVTGLLLVYNIPASSPFWLPIVGSFFAIVVVKQLFGGIGQNFLNPALAARAFLLASYPTEMTNWTHWAGGVDAIAQPTPLAVLKLGGFTPTGADYVNALIGNIGGSIGETCAVALLLGGAYLLARRVISWRIPAAYAVSFGAFVFLFGRGGAFSGYFIYEMLTGGFLLGALFMATDYTTSPMSSAGQLLFGAGCGLLASLIRCFGGYPEGVSYSILLMNLTVPLIDLWLKPRVFGHKRRAIFKKGGKK